MDCILINKNDIVAIGEDGKMILKEPKALKKVSILSQFSVPVQKKVIKIPFKNEMELKEFKEIIKRQVARETCNDVLELWMKYHRTDQERRQQWEKSKGPSTSGK